MIQQQSILCMGALKLIQRPTIAQAVSKSLWPAHVKGQIVIPFSCSSTVAHAQKSSTAQGTKGNDKIKQADTPKVEKSVTEVLIQQRPSGKEIEAVMKVKSVSQALEMCSDFNSQQRIYALKNLVLAQVRPLPLIQNLTEGICKSAKDLDIKQLSDLLFLLGKLSYVNEDVLSRTCSALRQKLKETTHPAVVGSSITSIRKLQWKDPDLLNELSVWIQKHFSKFQNPSAFIYTLALQNHSPPNLEDLLQMVWKDFEKQNYGHTHLINFVWSINVLNCSFTKDETRKALNELFHPKTLASIGTSPSDIPVWIKLWNLHAIAKSSWGQADNFQVPEAIRSKLPNILKRGDKSSMVSEIAQLLFKDLNTKLYSTNVPTQMGFPIDLVFCLDNKMNAVPLHLASSDCSRIAVMVHTYHECCQPTKEPNGYRTFEMRLLEDEFNVVSVPYHILGDGYSHVHEYFESALSKIVRNQS